MLDYGVPDLLKILNAAVLIPLAKEVKLLIWLTKSVDNIVDKSMMSTREAAPDGHFDKTMKI